MSYTAKLYPTFPIMQLSSILHVRQHSHLVCNTNNVLKIKSDDPTDIIRVIFSDLGNLLQTQRTYSCFLRGRAPHDKLTLMCKISGMQIENEIV